MFSLRSLAIPSADSSLIQCSLGTFGYSGERRSYQLLYRVNGRRGTTRIASTYLKNHSFTSALGVTASTTHSPESHLSPMMEPNSCPQRIRPSPSCDSSSLFSDVGYSSPKKAPPF